MSKIDEMIMRMCPHGVEYRNLGAINGCTISTGKGVTKVDIVTDGEYEIISGGVVPLGMIDRYNRDAGTVTIARAGSAGYVSWHEKPIYLNDKCFSVIPKTNDIIPKFLYYALKNKENNIIAMQSEGSVPTVNTEKVASIKIPVPPIEIQREIVRILDTFTELTAELTAELAARKKQYEFYRDKLFADLSNIEGGVKWKKLGELGEFYGGINGKTKEDFSNGNAVFISYKNVYENISTNIHPTDRVKVAAGEKQNVLQYGDVIFTGSSETPEECGLSSVVTETPEEPLYLNSFCFFLRIYDLTEVHPDYLKYLFRSFGIRKQICKTANGVTRHNVSKDKMKHVVIPIPPIEKQKEIASVLDNFSRICDDIYSGLPAEINLRQKQYEYYRDKLLSFTEAS